MRATVTALARDFERSTGHTVALGHGTAGPVQTRVAAGDAFDVAITTVMYADPAKGIAER